MTRIFSGIATIFFFISNGVFAQITVGARGGFGFSNTSLELAKGVSGSFGSAPQFGLMLHYNLDIKFSVGLEVNYARFSEKIIYQPEYVIGQKEELSSLTEISYIQIPITARASIGEKKYRAFVNVGPYIGFGQNGSWSKAPRIVFIDNFNPPTPKAAVFDTTYNLNQGKMKKLDLGGVVAAGIEYKVGQTGLVFFETRVQLGFLDIYNLTNLETRAFNQQGSNSYLVPSGSWRAVCFSLGYIQTFKLPNFNSNPDAKRAGKQKGGN